MSLRLSPAMASRIDLANEVRLATGPEGPRTRRAAGRGAAWRRLLLVRHGPKQTPRRAQPSRRLIGQRAGRDLPTPSLCILGRGDEDELITHSGRQNILARSELMPATDSEVEHAFSGAS